MVRDANMSYLQMCLGFVPGYLLVAFVLLPVYYKLRLTSIYDYLSRRFGSASHKTGASFFLISKLCGAAARMFMACLVLQKFVFAHFGIPFEATAVVTLLLTWAYTRKKRCENARVDRCVANTGSHSGSGYYMDNRIGSHAPEP